MQVSRFCHSQVPEYTEARAHYLQLTTKGKGTEKVLYSGLATGFFLSSLYDVLALHAANKAGIYSTTHPQCVTESILDILWSNQDLGPVNSWKLSFTSTWNTFADCCVGTDLFRKWHKMQLYLFCAPSWNLIFWSYPDSGLFPIIGVC